MDEHDIEAALRAGPPDEPTYESSVHSLLETRRAPSEPLHAQATVVELVPSEAGHRRRVLAGVIAVAAAAVLVVALVVANGRSNLPPVSTPTTVPAPRTTLVDATLLDQLAGRWVGATPETVQTPNPTAPAFVVFSGDRIGLEHLSGGIVTDFTSRVALTTDGHLRLTLVDHTGRCATDAVGDYRVTLSPQSKSLTLAAVNDACATRAAAFGGTWTHTECPTRGSDCLGRLEAGRYASVRFDPFASAAYGEVSFVVTAGWSSPVDDASRLTLLPPGGDIRGTHGLYLFADVAGVQGGCSATEAPGADGATIAEALTGRAGLEVVASDGTVDGSAARVLDITAAATLGCDGGEDLLVAKQGASPTWTLTISPGARMRIVLVDLPGGHTMAIVVASNRSAAEYSQLLTSSTAVIDSLALSAPG